MTGGTAPSRFLAQNRQSYRTDPEFQVEPGGLQQNCQAQSRTISTSLWRSLASREGTAKTSCSMLLSCETELGSREITSHSDAFRMPAHECGTAIKTNLLITKTYMAPGGFGSSAGSARRVQIFESRLVFWSAVNSGPPLYLRFGQQGESHGTNPGAA